MAGFPMCNAGWGAKTPNDAHAVYAPLSKPEFRETVCPACLQSWAESAYDDEDLPTAPDWVKLAVGFPR